MALIIAGERSGVGKTTLTLAMLAFLCRFGGNRGSPVPITHRPRVQSFKVGPDYIDPMFHQYVTGRPCRNLDPVLTSESYVQRCFAQHQQTADYVLIEGVMGLFDGASGSDDWASTAHIARLLGVPVLLVVDCGRLSRSVAAIVHGYRSFDPRLQIAGVVLNRVGSDRHQQLLEAALQPLNIPILGILRRDQTITLPDRHLGLIPAAELPHLDTTLDRLTHLAKTSLNWETLLPLLTLSSIHSPIHPPTHPSPLSSTLPPSHPLAIAQDAAFSFYYADNLELLQQWGAELIPWSPLKDSALPDGICGLYLGGGFPEVFAAALAGNQAARSAVYQAIQAGLPTYAECGGLMYLCQTLTDFDGHCYDMVGILPAQVRMGGRLTLGYRRAIALQDSPLLQRQTVVWGHEFHRSVIDQTPETPLFQMGGLQTPDSSTLEGWGFSNLHASYLHLHWGDRPDLPQRFLQACTRFARGQHHPLSPS